MFETKIQYDNYLDHVLIDKARDVADRVTSHLTGEYGESYNSVWISEFTKALILFRSWCKTDGKENA